jgi:hypothetical protein
MSSEIKFTVSATRGYDAFTKSIYVQHITCSANLATFNVADHFYCVTIGIVLVLNTLVVLNAHVIAV